MDMPDNAHVTVRVTRTGGFAGLRRQWELTSPPAPTRQVQQLIDACPWDDDDAEHTHPDAFTWVILVHDHTGERRKQLPESDLSEPWRDLIHAVRSPTAAPETAEPSDPEFGPEKLP